MPRSATATRPATSTSPPRPSLARRCCASSPRRAWGGDVASAGELAIALAAGFDPAHVLLHGNAKSDRDIADAIAAGVGLIVIDNADDVDRLVRLGRGRQPVLIRINPAVPGKTHAAVDTGSEASKFGVALHEAPALIDRVAGLEELELLGLHVHIGSQLLDLDGFAQAAQAIAGLGRFGVYDLGGGLGIAYRPGDEAPSVSDYGTRFAPAVLDRERPPETCVLVGHHCESGDVLATGVALATPQVDDVVVVPVTGAYCYSMLNNYNGARRPPVVLVAGGEARLVVRRERMSDLLARDVV